MHTKLQTLLCHTLPSPSNPFPVTLSPFFLFYVLSPVPPVTSIHSLFTPSLHASTSFPSLYPFILSLPTPSTPSLYSLPLLLPSTSSTSFSYRLCQPASLYPISLPTFPSSPFPLLYPSSLPLHFPLFSHSIVLSSSSTLFVF